MAAKTEADRWRKGQKNARFNKPAEKPTTAEKIMTDGATPDEKAVTTEQAAWEKHILNGCSPAG